MKKPTMEVAAIAPLVAEILHTKGISIEHMNMLLKMIGLEQEVKEKHKVRILDIGEFRFLTQNPDKNSFWGEKAREGSEITWVIHIPTNDWTCRVVDGEVEYL